MILQVNKLIKLSDGHKLLSRTHNHQDYSVSFTEYAVPTELVICAAGYYTPTVARAYVGRWFDAVDGKVDTDRPTGLVRGATQCIVVEVWEDQGADGHTVYRHTGYRMVPTTQYHEEQTAGHGSLLPCMQPTQAERY